MSHLQVNFFENEKETRAGIDAMAAAPSQPNRLDASSRSDHQAGSHD